ncbi:trypsin-like serine protease [Cognatishimia sp. WU-CL00825]|uniref:trypsin-like serine peptidase n=1 Tax=Cognatishimia sp. WU-CL00825 TaxID=3127658 RepID=UPI00310B4F5F
MSRVMLFLVALLVMPMGVFAQNAGAFSAVGRLELAGRGFCTGTLIAPDLVLTAAHCLYDKQNGARFDVGQLEFKAGYRQGVSVAKAGVMRAAVHPEYDARKKGQLHNLRFDLALLKLSRSVKNQMVKPMGVANPDLGGRTVGVLSYGAGRAEDPQLESACVIKGRPEGIFVTTCKARHGTSGAPVLQVVNGRAQLVSVVSAMARANGLPVALAAAPKNALDILEHELSKTLLSELGN